MTEALNVDLFIEEWLNHLSVDFVQNYEVDSTVSLDFYIPQWSVGIYVINWKKPISVQIINKAIQMVRKLQLSKLYLVASEISQSAQKTLEKYGQNVISVHPNGLSEIAIGFAKHQLQPTASA